MPKDFDLRKAALFVETGELRAAYDELHAGLQALSGSVLHETLAQHLLVMADTAMDMHRPDLALQNLRVAAGVFDGLPTATRKQATPGDLATRILTLENALALPFESLEEERRWMLEIVRLWVKRAAREAVLRKELDPSQDFEFEIRAEEFDLFADGSYPADEGLFLLQRECMALREWTLRRQLATPDLHDEVEEGEAPAFRSLTTLMRRFELDANERFLLLLALAPAIYPQVQRAYMRLWGDYLKREPDVAFLARLASIDPGQAGQGEATSDSAEELSMLRALGPTARLITSGLLQVYPGNAAAESPRLFHAVAASDVLVRYALGQERVTSLQGHDDTSLDPGGTGAAKPLIDEEAAQRIATALEAEKGAVCVHGPKGSGKRTLVRQVGEELGLPLLELRLRATDQDGVEALLRGALRDTRILDGLLALDLSGLGTDARASEVLHTIFHVRAGLPARLVLVIEDLPDLLWDYLDRQQMVRIAYPTPEDQQALWQYNLERLDLWRSHMAGLVSEVISRYPSTPDNIRRSAIDALERARIQRGEQAELGLGDLLWAAQNQTNARILTVAERVQTTMTWEDLILPQPTLVALNEIVTYFRYKEEVFESWGFKRKLPYGRALTSLFYGPPGTGKTMAAAILGREFGMPLFRVDLSSVVSKYIGETEKNLNRVFEEAEFARAVILFDEADSLFGKRTEVKSSTDRYANLEVNFLLQKIEAFDGVVILTTNLDTALDEAFRRRIRYKVHFPFPDSDLRGALWASILPKEAPVEGALDLEELAQRFEMSGANIKNAVIRAAFMSAEEGAKLSQQALLKGANREYKEMGKLIREETDDDA